MTLSIAPQTSALLGNYKRAPSELVDGNGVYLIDALTAAASIFTFTNALNA
jgi:hypothetical protein